MIFGIGTDILKIERIGLVAMKPDDPFLKRTYSLNELEEAFQRDKPELYLATRFAGKEAVFKALSPSPEHVELSEIEILNDENGKPCVTLHGELYKYSKNIGIDEILISLSYDTDYAIAYAMAQASDRINATRKSL